MLLLWAIAVIFICKFFAAATKGNNIENMLKHYEDETNHTS